MAIWLVRAGQNGEYENKFLSEGRIYLTWEKLGTDLSEISEKPRLLELLNNVYPDNKQGRIRNWAGQIWPFVKEFSKGDWVVLPSKQKAAIHFGEITGDYTHDADGNDPYFHFRTVSWFATDIPRSNFDQDILYSMGAFLTICRISRNDAEARIKVMAKNRWQVPGTGLDVPVGEEADRSRPIDLEELTRDQIAKFIIRKFKGHGMARLINAILRAQGYSTHVSPEGPDKGVDILAAPGPLGFGTPRLCVQVKSGEAPLDRPTLDQLIGAMQNFNADQGLLVSWGGFKSSVDREIPSHFFRVRLWDQNEIIDQLLKHYDGLGEDIRAEIPLKRIWSLVVEED